METNELRRPWAGAVQKPCGHRQEGEGLCANQSYGDPQMGCSGGHILLPILLSDAPQVQASPHNPQPHNSRIVYVHSEMPGR